MKSRVQSMFLAVAVLMGTGVKAEVARCAAAAPVWSEFAVAWGHRVAADAEVAQAWQEVQQVFQQIAQTPYELSEISPFVADFELHTDYRYINPLKAIAQVVSESSREEVVSLLNEIAAEFQNLALGERKDFAFALNNCPVTDVLMVALHDIGILDQIPMDNTFNSEKQS